MARLIATGIGIDSGASDHALYYLEAFDDGMIWPVEPLYRSFDRGITINLLARLAPRAGVAQGVVAMETITGKLYGDAAERRKRKAGVETTRGKENLFRNLVSELRIPFVDRPAAHGRKKIIGNEWASDDQIQAGIEGIYTTITPGDDLPPVLERHRPHLYDAIIVSMTELYERMVGVDDKGAEVSEPLVHADLVRKIRQKLKFPGSFLPDDVRAKVEAIRRQEWRIRTEEDKRRLEGRAPLQQKARRIPTRATAQAGKEKAAATRLRNKLRRI